MKDLKWKMGKLVVGILAHVDAGKTTLSEALLYESGKIGKLGRVDTKDAYLDTYELEKARGITIFSKQALFNIGNIQITLLDTPGHVDFSAEMERTLSVLDYAVLVINAADGIQGHTKTLWRLLDIYKIPVFLFINKMDQKGIEKDNLVIDIKNKLNKNCVEFGETNYIKFYDDLAMCDETLMDMYLEKGQIELNHIKECIKERIVFPCFFGSALKLEGIRQFLEGVEKYSCLPTYTEDFGAKIFKISRDEQGNRLTHMKITGGRLKVKDVIVSEGAEEKVNQIRLYSGQKFESVDEVLAGSICAVIGPNKTKIGRNLGIETVEIEPLLEPVLAYQIILPDGYDPRVIMPKLKQIEEEEPELHIIWDEQLEEIQARIMGEVQIEILQSLIKNRFGVSVTFGVGSIVYKETILNSVEGVGHFEPLRHYAEVHLLMESGERGSGLKFESICSDDELAKNWQKLVLNHLEEKIHKGVLTGSAITDMKITLVSGRAHNKHTEGGDFRQATYRAVRQGLMEAESVLLEPYYDFQLEIPENLVGRAMSDISKMQGVCEISQTINGFSMLVGSAPVINMRNYQMEVMAYTKGLGRLFCSLKGYDICSNMDEVIAEMGYDSARDIENPTGSVFCKNGVGFLVDWNEVKQYMHLESYLQSKKDFSEENSEFQNEYKDDQWISLDEIDEIMNTTYYKNQGKKSVWKKHKTALESYYENITPVSRQKETTEEYLIVDGYNIIYAWTELKELADENMDSARIKLLDYLCNYQGIRKCNIIVVFDAYLVKGHSEEIMDYHNVHVVFTREAETADRYIEKFVHKNQKQYSIVVATSDGLEQIIIRGAGSFLLSARELKAEIDKANEIIKRNHENAQIINHNYLMDELSDETKMKIEKLIKDEKEE